MENETKNFLIFNFLILCFGGRCSQKEAKAMDEELLTEYSFTPEQTIELSGLTCATAIAQVNIVYIHLTPVYKSN